MNRIAKLFNDKPMIPWLILLLTAVSGAYLTNEMAREMHQAERSSLLQTDVERRSIEIMSQTLNGNLMGALGLLARIEPEMAREALGGLNGNQPGESKVEAKGRTVFVSTANTAKLKSIGQLHAVEGTFVVRADGIIGSGWDQQGKPSTALDVNFRPYFKMAMQGKDNVYAAVSQARNDRMLYFSTPIFSGNSKETQASGALVARSGLKRVDDLMLGKTDISLLLSPQGLVFASSRPEWIGRMAGQASPERLKAIRETKQFGDRFASKDPLPLPFSLDRQAQQIDGKSFVLAQAKVQWNDPLGDWTLVFIEDLSRTAPASKRLSMVLAGTGLILFLGILLINLLRGQYRQRMAAVQLAAYSQAQQASVERKSQIASAALNFQRAKRSEELVQIFFAETRTLFGALQGVVYVLEYGSTATFRLLGSYACQGTLPPSLALGEGLLGQCAVERRLQLLSSSPDGFASIYSGLGNTAPTAILMAPIELNGKLLGIVEIALLHHPSQAEQGQFEEITGLLAMNLETLGRSQFTEESLSTAMTAERTHTEQLAFQQILIDTIPYPVFYKGPDARFIGVNRAYEKAFNIQRDSLIGKQVLDLLYLPEADRIAYQTEDEAIIRRTGTIQRELQLTFADSHLHDVLYFVSGFRRPDGEPGGLVGTFIDISQLKNAERELESRAESERFYRLAEGREERILELKQEVNEQAVAAGQKAPYVTTLVETVGDHETAPHPDYHTAPIETTRLQLVELVDLLELQKLFTAFCESVGIAAAIIDLNGKVLALNLQNGQDFTQHAGKNGLEDWAAPIIVEGQHLANVFIDPPRQSPPEEKRLPVILGFLSGFAQMISSLSLAQHRAALAQQKLQEQAVLLRAERLAAMSLAEDNIQARQALAYEMGHKMEEQS